MWKIPTEKVKFDIFLGEGKQGLTTLHNPNNSQGSWLWCDIGEAL